MVRFERVIGTVRDHQRAANGKRRLGLMADPTHVLRHLAQRLSCTSVASTVICFLKSPGSTHSHTSTLSADGS